MIGKKGSLDKKDEVLGENLLPIQKVKSAVEEFEAEIEEIKAQ